MISFRDRLEIMRMSLAKWLGLGALGAGGLMVATKAASATAPEHPAPRRPVAPFPYGGVGTSAAFLEGIDVSSAQGPNVDWEKAKESASLSFAIAKASQGAPGYPSGFADATFARNRSGMTALLPFWGGYHYAILARPTAPQVDLFVKQLGTLDDETMLPPAVDLEWDLNAGATGRRTIDFLYEWDERMRAIRGRRSMIYTAAGWWGAIGNPVDPIQGAYALWVAHWTEAPKPLIPRGWSKYDLWQYSAEAGPMSEVAIAGIPGAGKTKKAVDRDRFRGTLEDMRAFVDASRV